MKGSPPPNPPPSEGEGKCEGGLTVVLRLGVKVMSKTNLRVIKNL
jgi:hypothetical protein